MLKIKCQTITNKGTACKRSAFMYLKDLNPIGMPELYVCLPHFVSGIKNYLKIIGEEVIQMPLTKKGRKIEGAMKKEYGAKKGKQIFYASKNRRIIKGVEEKKRK